MRFTRSPSLSEELEQDDLAAHDLDDRRDAFDERQEMAPEDATYDERVRWPQSQSQSYGPGRASVSANNHRSTGRRPSIIRRMLRAIGRFVFVVLIGVGVTLAWQAYGDDARAAVRIWAPSLAWLIPGTAAKSPASASSPDVGQRLQPIALDIAIIRREVEQLAAGQQQLAVDQQQLGANEVHIAQTIATLQATEQEVREKVLSVHQGRTVHSQRSNPEQPPAPSADGQ